MTTSGTKRQTEIFGEAFLIRYLVRHHQLPQEQLGWMSAELGLTEKVRAYLANPQLKLMIVEAPYGAEAQPLTHFRTAKAQRPDVAFLVVSSPVHYYDEEEHNRLFQAAGAEYIISLFSDWDQEIERIDQIAAEFAKKSS